MFKDKMKTPAIPERVFTLCKIVEKGDINKTDLKNKMEPDFVDNTSAYFRDYYEAAEELNLISESDGMVSLAVDKEVIKSTESLRKFINGNLENFKDGHFYKMTKAYFSSSSDVLYGETNIAASAGEYSAKAGIQLDAPSLRAWRFWVTFLGLAYLHEMFVMPNASVFLHDVIEITQLKKGEKYAFGDFVDAISPYCGIIIDPNKRVLNYGASCGLRTLHDAGIIQMEHILDQEDIWSLYPFEQHSIDQTVTNITICK